MGNDKTWEDYDEEEWEDDPDFDDFDDEEPEDDEDDTYNPDSDPLFDLLDDYDEEDDDEEEPHFEDDDFNDTVDDSASDTATENEEEDEDDSDEEETFDRAYVHKLRQEAAQYRTRAKEAEQSKQATLQQLTELVADRLDPNVTPDTMTVDVIREALQQDNTEVVEELRQARIENAIIREASKLDIDVDALTDSVSFLESVESLDPNANDFNEQIFKAVERAAQKPHFVRQRADRRSAGSAPSAQKIVADMSVEGLRERRRKRRNRS